MNKITSPKKWASITAIALAMTAVVISLMSCNVFDPIDNPSGDSQLLSAARACFDQGDFDCALKYYGELSSDNNDIKNSEEAFTTLDKEGASMSVFMQAIGDGGSGGKILTRMAKLMKGLTTDATKRVALYAAYSKVSSITSGELRGLVRFAASLALAGAMLAESNGADDTFDQNDLTAAPATCLTGGATACAVSGCTSIIASGSASVDLDTGSSSVSATTVTLDMFHATVKQMVTATGSTELGATGKFGTGASDFATTLSTTFNPQTSASCYVYGLLSKDLGL